MSAPATATSFNALIEKHRERDAVEDWIERNLTTIKRLQRQGYVDARNHREAMQETPFRAVNEDIAFDDYFQAALRSLDLMGVYKDETEAPDAMKEAYSDGWRDGR